MSNQKKNSYDVAIRLTSLDIQNESFTGIAIAHNRRELTITRHPKARQHSESFKKALRTASVGGYIMVDQMDEDLTAQYIQVIKPSRNSDRYVAANRHMNISMFRIYGNGKRQRITNTDEFLDAKQAGNTIFMLTTFAKSEALQVTGPEELHLMMVEMFNASNNNSHTPKIELFNEQGEELSIHAKRTDHLLDKEATIQHIYDDQYLKDFLANSATPVYALKSLFFRMSNFTTQAMVDSLLKSMNGGRSRAIVDRFFDMNNTKEGKSLYGRGVLSMERRLSDAGHPYEFGVYARNLGTRGMGLLEMARLDGQPIISQQQPQQVAEPQAEPVQQHVEQPHYAPQQAYNEQQYQQSHDFQKAVVHDSWGVSFSE